MTHLEQHVLNLYRKVLDQRLPEQRMGMHGRHSEPSSPCSHAEKRHAMAGDSRFKLETRFLDLSPQHRRHVSAAAAAAAASSQGSKRPHSAISTDLLRTRHSSLLGGTFYSIDEEPRETLDFSGELPSVSTPKMPKLSSSSLYEFIIVLKKLGVSFFHDPLIDMNVFHFDSVGLCEGDSTKALLKCNKSWQGQITIESSIDQSRISLAREYSFTKLAFFRHVLWFKSHLQLSKM